MIRLLKRLFTLVLTLFLIGAFAYFVLLPRVLPRDYREFVERYAGQYQLEDSLVYAVIFCESHFNAKAVSSAGAIGLMQVTEETGQWAAKQIGLDAAALDLTNPETNINVGCWYLKWLDEKFNGIRGTGLAAYNAGHGNVAKWLADEEKSKDGITLDEIPFGETKSYVKRVEMLEKIYRLVYRM